MVQVTDHAVLRHLQRHHGIDVEGVRAHLAVKGLDVAAAIHCETVILGCGCRLKLRGDHVVTCLGHTKRRPARQQRSPR